MGTRQLTKQQSRRIKQNIATRQTQYQPTHSASLGPEQSGLVISHHGKSLIVENDQGSRYQCYSRPNIGQPVCGDHVIWQAANNREGVITMIRDRSNLLVRTKFADKIKPVAANITLMFIVIAPEPEPQASLIDRYLVTAEHLNIKPVILCNKSDLFDPEATYTWQEPFFIYQKLGYELLTTSARQIHTLERVKQQLVGNNSIFVGQSGVGKSSLTNCLIADRKTGVKTLSRKIAKGQHTTSYSELLHLPDNGGNLIDSPGVRSFRLVHLDRHAIENGFIEFRPLLGQCRFSDCRHLNEPDCAILAAINNGEINAQRFASYRKIIDQG